MATLTPDEARQVAGELVRLIAELTYPPARESPGPLTGPRLSAYAGSAGSVSGSLRAWLPPACPQALRAPATGEARRPLLRIR